jgi:hypothetical protein
MVNEQKCKRLRGREQRAGGGRGVVQAHRFRLTSLRFLLLLFCSVVLIGTSAEAQVSKLPGNASKVLKPALAVPAHAIFRVQLQGFVVHRQTWDDALNSDGWGDEVYVVYNLDTIDLLGRTDLIRTSSWGSFTSLYGDTGGGSNTVRAGSATPNGGLQTGDRYPSGPWTSSTSVGSTFFEAELVRGRSALVLIPAIFESDRSRSITDAYNRAVFASRTAVQGAVTELIRGPALTTAAQILRRGETLGLDGLTSSVLHGAGFTGESGDRPVGMVPPPPGRSTATYTFVPQGFVLTYEAADAIVNNDLFGAGRGVAVVRYNDDERLRGQYSLFFHIERVP